MTDKTTMLTTFQSGTRSARDCLDDIIAWSTEVMEWWHKAERDEGASALDAAEYCIESLRTNSVLMSVDLEVDDFSSIAFQNALSTKSQDEFEGQYRLERMLNLLQAARVALHVKSNGFSEVITQLNFGSGNLEEENSILEQQIVRHAAERFFTGVALSFNLTSLRSFIRIPGLDYSSIGAQLKLISNSVNRRGKGGYNKKWLPIARGLRIRNPEWSRTKLTKAIIEEYPEADHSSVMRALKPLFEKPKAKCAECGEPLALDGPTSGS